MLVAITGGTGFIGKKVVGRLLERGDTVRLLTRGSGPFDDSPRLEIYQCDLLAVSVSDLSVMLDGVEVLYHCAGSVKHRPALRALHVDGTHALAEAASRRVRHWVQLSSVGVYGPTTEGWVTEDSQLNPVGEYELAKAESDRIIVAASDKGGFTYSILRPSNVFGAGMSNQSLFAMIAVLDRGLFFYIGEPGASANYVHVDSVADAVIRCGTIRSAEGRSYNVSDHCTLEQFVAIIVQALGCGSPRLRIPKTMAHLATRTLGWMPGFPLTQSRVDALANRSIYPISRIRQELAYEPVTTIADGLRELVVAYELHSRHR